MARGPAFSPQEDEIIRRLWTSGAAAIGREIEKTLGRHRANGTVRHRGVGILSLPPPGQARRTETPRADRVDRGAILLRAERIRGE